MVDLDPGVDAEIAKALAGGRMLDLVDPADGLDLRVGYPRILF
jgi:hypothetical protein